MGPPKHQVSEKYKLPWARLSCPFLWAGMRSFSSSADIIEAAGKIIFLMIQI